MATRLDPSALLRFALADDAARSALGLSQRKLAAEIGISPRSLMRYLRGERAMPEAVGLRLTVKAEDVAPDLQAMLAAKARKDEVPAPKGTRAPVAAHRYVPPKSPITGERRSEIVIVNTEGLTNAEVGEIVIAYWRELSQTGTDWNIRFLVRVNVDDYFDGEEPEKPDVRKSIKGRTHVNLWVPPQHFSFVRRRARDVGSMVHFRRPSDVLGYLNEYLQSNYAGRLPADFIFQKIAFIPYRTGKDGKRFQKRRGKR